MKVTFIHSETEPFLPPLLSQLIPIFLRKVEEGKGGEKRPFFPCWQKRVESGSQASQGYTYIYGAAAMLSLLCPPAGRRRMDERREFLGEDGGRGGGGAKKF